MSIKGLYDKLKKRIKLKRQRNKNIDKIVAATGWSRKTAAEKMDNAKKQGLLNWQYVMYKAWLLSEDEIFELINSLKLKKKKGKSIYVQIVCGETYWSYKEAKDHMDIFLKRGISYNTYVTQKFYDLSEEEIEKRIKSLEEKDNEYIDRVSEATGWTREEAIREMDRVKDKLGVSYFKYCSYRFFTNTDEEIKARLDKWNRTVQNQIDYATQESGWDRRKVRLHMNKVRTIFEIPPDYYILYRLWELSDEQIKTYARRKDSNRLFAKYNNKDETRILQKKELFDEYYKDYIKRKFWINRDTDFEKFKKFIEGLDYIFCKPIDSGGGQGTEKLKISDYDSKELYDYLMNKDKILVEECVVQHRRIDAFAPGCVNTIRVITLLKDGVCNIICAGIRIGNGGIVDNFHADGMVCDVDLNTGIIITPAIDRSGNIYERHPKSGIEFVGFKIPNWEMVLKLAEDAIRVQPGVNYVGWDIAVCEDKAVIIEGNTAPDLVLIQAPYARQQRGMKYLFEKYF